MKSNILRFNKQEELSQKESILNKLREMTEQVSNTPDNEINDTYHSLLIVSGGATHYDIKYVNMNIIDILGLLEYSKMYLIANTEGFDDEE